MTPVSPGGATPERKVLGSSKLPPPPTRTIGLNDKLPPARRPPSPSSDDDSGSEEGAGGHGGQKQPALVDNLPDSSRSSRRPPVLSYSSYSSEYQYTQQQQQQQRDPKVTCPLKAHILHAGSMVVIAEKHYVRVHDLTLPTSNPERILDAKGIVAKDVKITAIAWRSTTVSAEPWGCPRYVWVGSKEGHLFEVDLELNTISACRPSAHLHAVTAILALGGSTMVSLDESGKMLVFATGEMMHGGKPGRIATGASGGGNGEKALDWVECFGGRIWSATRNDWSSITASSSSTSLSSTNVPSSTPVTGNQSKVPILRVHDVDVNTGAVFSRTLVPCSHTGPVTCATMLPSDPGRLYVGHEEGYISIWENILPHTKDNPRCVEVMKVGTSDVISLEGVHDRLWAGGRSGVIVAYDVKPRPWTVTNSWAAYDDGVPVMKIRCDYWEAARGGAGSKRGGAGMRRRMGVMSVGKDECVRFWDGLLGYDWIGKWSLS